MLKVIVAGSRSFNNFDLLENKLKEILSDTDRPIIVSGNASGADKLGEKFADKYDLEKIIMPACWEGFEGNSAGIIRNRLMADIADACVCFWDGESKGTREMIRIAQKKELPVRVIKYNN